MITFTAAADRSAARTNSSYLHLHNVYVLAVYDTLRGYYPVRTTRGVGVSDLRGPRISGNKKKVGTYEVSSEGKYKLLEYALYHVAA